MINFLTKLLVGAYNLEARKFHKAAQVQGKLANKAGDRATELAAESREQMEHSIELTHESRANVDRAVAMLAKAKEVESFFLGDVK